MPQSLVELQLMPGRRPSSDPKHPANQHDQQQNHDQIGECLEHQIDERVEHCRHLFARKSFLHRHKDLARKFRGWPLGQAARTEIE